MEMSQQRVEGCSLEIGTQKQRQEGRALLCGGRGGRAAGGETGHVMGLAVTRTRLKPRGRAR